jgi:23S rRNA (cytosine1962-C5)-methyltransferase
MSKVPNLPAPVRWTLKKGSDRRVREGHPWIFSNELSVSPKGLPAGAPIEIVDYRGEYLGFGYGNPHSLIAGRLFSARVGEAGDLSHESLLRRVLFCWKRRLQMGLNLSARLVFGEADEFPGMVLDRYLCRSNPALSEPDYQVFAAQFTTAGADRILAPALSFFEELVRKAQSEGHTGLGWENTAVILRNDIKKSNIYIFIIISLNDISVF